jgi:GNAT superfamily N-acetyltransferase
MTFTIRELDHRDSKKWAEPLAELSAKLWADTFIGISYYTPEIVKGLSRFYLDRSVHGSGLAKKLLDSVNGTAEARGFLSLWLSVLELNVPAVKFYTKHGFIKVGEWEYPYTSHGKRYIDIDWLMVRQIK